MKHYTLSVEIEQPIARVAELFGDPETLPFWQPGFQGLEKQDDGTTKLRYLNRGREVVMIETVIKDDLPREYTSRFVVPGMMAMTVANRFEEIAPDRTRYVSENTAESQGLMMKIIGFLMPGCFKKESLRYMENFKAFAEHGTDVREAGGS